MLQVNLSPTESNQRLKGRFPKENTMQLNLKWGAESKSPQLCRSGKSRCAGTARLGDKGVPQAEMSCGPFGFSWKQARKGCYNRKTDTPQGFHE